MTFVTLYKLKELDTRIFLRNVLALSVGIFTAAFFFSFCICSPRNFTQNVNDVAFVGARGFVKLFSQFQIQ